MTFYILRPSMVWEWTLDDDGRYWYLHEIGMPPMWYVSTEMLTDAWDAAAMLRMLLQEIVKRLGLWDCEDPTTRSPDDR